MGGGHGFEPPGWAPECTNLFEGEQGLFPAVHCVLSQVHSVEGPGFEDGAGGQQGPVDVDPVRTRHALPVRQVQHVHAVAGHAAQQHNCGENGISPLLLKAPGLQWF